jgi:hypothetical protein
MGSAKTRREGLFSVRNAQIMGTYAAKQERSSSKIAAVVYLRNTKT